MSEPARFDPRSVLFALCFLTIAAFVAPWPAGVLIAVSLLTLRVTVARGGSPWLFVALAGGGVVAFVLNGLLIRSGQVVFQLPIRGFEMTDDGLRRGVELGLRVVNLGWLAELASRLAPLEEMPDAIGALATPRFTRSRRLHAALFRIRLALRFVPVLIDEGRSLVSALTLRGLRPEGTWERIRFMPRLFIPIWVRALIRADRLALVLDSRGIDAGAPRVYLPGRRWHRHDTRLVGLSAGLLAITIWAGAR